MLRQSKVEFQHAQAIVNARLKRVQQAVIKTPEKIKEFNGKNIIKNFLMANCIALLLLAKQKLV